MHNCIQELIEKCQIISPRLIPSVGSAVRDLESNGGQLTLFSSFGKDPLQGSPTLAAQREAEF